MAAIAKKEFYTAEEYFALEEQAEYRSEYYYGEIFAMAGGTARHSEVSMNAGWAFKSALRGRPCKVYNSDLKIELSANGYYSYPDLSIVCGNQLFSAINKNALQNPLLIVEVLSKGTENYDRNLKFAHYRQISSLREYVLIHQDTPWVEVYTKETNSWTLRDYIGIDAIARFETLEIEIPLSEFYDGV